MSEEQIEPFKSPQFSQGNFQNTQINTEKTEGKLDENQATTRRYKSFYDYYDDDDEDDDEEEDQKLNLNISQNLTASGSAKIYANQTVSTYVEQESTFILNHSILNQNNTIDTLFTKKDEKIDHSKSQSSKQSSSSSSDSEDIINIQAYDNMKKNLENKEYQMKLAEMEIKIAIEKQKKAEQILKERYQKRLNNFEKKLLEKKEIVFKPKNLEMAIDDHKKQVGLFNKLDYEEQISEIQINTVMSICITFFRLTFFRYKQVMSTF